MKKSLYEITIGYAEDGTIYDNWRGVTVLALDVVSAIRKVRLRKGEFHVSVDWIGRADIE